MGAANSAFTRNLLVEETSAIAHQLPPREPDQSLVIGLNRRQRAKVATRMKLLASARRLFLSVGYFATGIRDIAADMGMSTGAVFSQVEDKAELWRLAVGGPAPSEDVAEEIALLLALLPGWGWALIRKADGSFFATLSTPGYRPGADGEPAEGAVWIGRGLCPASALRAARTAEEADRS